MKITLLLSLLSAVSTVMGHGFVQEFLIGGERYTGSLPFSDPYKNPVPERITQPFYENGNSFIDNVNSKDIACNKGSKPAKLVALAPAGSQVTFFWTPWPESHKGPIITYLAHCGGDCTTAIGSELNWFKIDESGLLPDGTWAAEALIKNNNTYTLSLPRKIKNGQYLMRHEIIALHASHEMNGSQFYPSCTNIEITGASEENTPETVKFPGAYSPTDPGIFLNIYYPKVTNYTIPGPARYMEIDEFTPPSSTAAAIPAPSSAFPSLIPTKTEGIFPTGGAPVGTGGVPIPPVETVPPVPIQPTYVEPTEIEPTETESLITRTVVTTIVTTIAGNPITLTATYTTECTCTDDIPTAVPEPTVEPQCGEKTITVTVTERLGAVPSNPVVENNKPEYTTISSINTVIDIVTKTIPTTTSVPTSIAAVPVPEQTIATDSYFSVIPFPIATTTNVEAPASTTTQTYEPSGTGAPINGYEGALTKRDCEAAFDKCKRTYQGCMKRAKRSGLQTRSCEKFKRDICVEGLRGCDSKILG